METGEENPKHKLQYGGIRKLSLAFSKHIVVDIAKSSIIPPKAILEGLSLWPGKDSLPLKILNWGVVLNLTFMEWGHLSYVILNITDIPKMASACTTVSTTFQTACKVITLRIHKKILNEILCHLWDDFWPADIVSEETKKTIKRNMLFVKFFCFMYLCTAFVSCSQFMMFPLVKRNGNLPLASTFPFSYDGMPTYELFYVWQYFSNFIVVTVLSGHDFLMSTLIMNLVSQFQILQEVLQNIYMADDPALRKNIYKKFNIQTSPTMEKELFIKCITHHIKLMKICSNMETVFSFIIFVQFFVSTVALCVSSFVLTVNASEAMNMLSYAMAHFMQLFIYCSMGNELIFQSQGVSDAAFQCGWHIKFDDTVRRGLLLLIQRAHKQSQLSALGFVELSYRSFLMVMRLSFSFYTMLNNMKNKKMNIN